MGFESLGDFLKILFYNPTCVDGQDDPRGVTHGLAVARFLQGKTRTKMSEIIGLIYSRKHSAPSPRSTQYHERHASFSPSISQLSTMHVLRCFLGPPISSAAMSIKIYISLPRRTMTLSLGDPLMADAQRIALDWLLGRFWGNSALLDFVRSTSCVRLSLGISPSLWLPRAKMVL